MKNYFLVDYANGISKSLTHALNRHLEKLEVSYTQGRLLLHLFEEEGQKQKMLSERLEIEPATTVRTLDRMERDGLIRRQRNAMDRRTINIFLTEEGKLLCPKILSTCQEFESKLLDSLGESSLPKLLEHIYQTLSKQERY